MPQWIKKICSFFFFLFYVIAWKCTWFCSLFFFAYFSLYLPLFLSSFFFFSFHFLFICQCLCEYSRWHGTFFLNKGVYFILKLIWHAWNWLKWSKKVSRYKEIYFERHFMRTKNGKHENAQTLKSWRNASRLFEDKRIAGGKSICFCSSLIPLSELLSSFILHVCFDLIEIYRCLELAYIKWVTNR